MRIRIGLSQKFVLFGTLSVTLTIIISNFVSHQWHRATIFQEISEKPLFIVKNGVLLLDSKKVEMFLTQKEPHSMLAEDILSTLYDIRNRNNPKSIVSLLAKEPGNREGPYDQEIQITEVLSTDLGLFPRFLKRDDLLYEDVTIVLERGEPIISEPYETDRGTFLSAFALIGEKNSASAVLEVGYPINVAEELWQSRDRMILTSYLLGFITTLGLAIYVARRFISPINDLSLAISSLSQGDYTYPIEIRSLDEIGQLAKTFETMRETINTQKQELLAQRDRLIQTTHELEALTTSLDAQVEHKTEELKATLTELKNTQDLLVQREKMASVGELAGGIAHEINTPLAVIVTRIGYLLSITHEEGVKEEFKEDLEAIYQQAIRISRIIRSLLDYSRQQPQSKRKVSIPDLLDACLMLLKDRMSSNIAITKHFELDLPSIHVDKERMEYVFLNLIKNAIEVMPDGGGLTLQGKRSKLKGEQGDIWAIAVSISDTGPGIPKEHQIKIFDPFFTTKAPGKGTGLGLYMSYGIVQEHKGSLFVQSELGKGATFTVTLPIETIREDA